MFIFYQTPNEYKSTINFRLLLSLLLPSMIKQNLKVEIPPNRIAFCRLNIYYLLFVVVFNQSHFFNVLAFLLPVRLCCRVEKISCDN